VRARAFRLACFLASAALACAAAAACNTNYGSIDHVADDAGGGGGEGGEGGVTADGGGEAGSSGPFCQSRRASNPIFCDDFDVAPAFDDLWTYHGTAGYDGGGTNDLDHVAFVSSPAALEIGVPSANPNYDSLTNRLGFEFTQAITKSAHLEADLRIDSIDDLHYAYLVMLELGSTNPQQIVLAASGTDSRVQLQSGNATPTTQRLTNVATKGAWMHVVMDVTLGAQPSLAITFAGATDTVPLPSTYGTVPPGGQIDVGVGYYDNVVVAATTVHVDNVLFTAE
jgi:hypothetical protein